MPKSCLYVFKGSTVNVERQRIYLCFRKPFAEGDHLLLDTAYVFTQFYLALHDRTLFFQDGREHLCVSRAPAKECELEHRVHGWPLLWISLQTLLEQLASRSSVGITRTFTILFVEDETELFRIEFTPSSKALLFRTHQIVVI
jgi:hypothetical protein